MVCNKFFFLHRPLHANETHWEHHLADPKYKWSCYICKETFKRAVHLCAHSLAQHSTYRPYHCLFCQFTLLEKGQLMKHEDTHTRATQYSCDICRTTFFHLRDLIILKSIHSNERNMQCEYYDKYFKSDVHGPFGQLRVKL